MYNIEIFVEASLEDKPMKIACDLCGQLVEDSLLQIVEEGAEILYACPECYVQSMEGPPEEQA